MGPWSALRLIVICVNSLTLSSGVRLNLNLTRPATKLISSTVTGIHRQIDDQLQPLTLCSLPPNFPSSIELRQHKYLNWAQEISVPAVLTAIPRTADDVVLLANWAAASDGYRLRAMGFSHTWAPTTVTTRDRLAGSCPKIILVYTLPHLNNISLESSTPGTGTGVIRAQPGAWLLDLLSFAETHGLGFHNHPASGDHSVGGILAIGGHGAGVRQNVSGPPLPPGFTLGSVSNLILSMTFVAWDEDTSSYALREFRRGVDQDAPAFFTHLGRTFVTEVTLQAGPLRYLRCQSFTNVRADELFANPADDGIARMTIASLLDSSAAFEIILFAFTKRPWLKVWTIVDPTSPPSGSRFVSTPFNYPFTYIVPASVSAVVAQINAGLPLTGASLGPVSFQSSVLGLAATGSGDIWGAAKNVLLFVKPSTIRTTNAGFCILTRRADVQLISYTVYSFYTRLLDEYANSWLYPINVGLELRVGGVDTGSASELPWLSSASPHPSHPKYDTTIWIELLTLPSTPHHEEFMSTFEQFLLSTYSLESDLGLARPEWSKGWAYTCEEGWANQTILNEVYPELYPEMQRARDVYAKYDPQRIFINEFLNEFL